MICTIGKRLRQLRRTLDLTQQEFADKLGIKRNTVASYETKDDRAPVGAVISLICKEFNVNEEWLRNGTGEMFVKLDPETALMQWAGTVLADTSNSFQKRFVTMLSKLTEQDWTTLEKIAVLLHDTENKDT